MNKTGMKSTAKTIMTSVALMFCLTLPVYSNTSQSGIDLPQAISTQTVEETTKITKKTNNEAKHVFKKFFHAMLLVSGSCLAIFLLLLLFKKATTPKETTKRKIDTSKDLKTPETIQDATLFFIEKF